MISVEILTTGTELLRGRSIDTNFSYMARRLVENGLEPKYHSTFGDDLNDLLQGLAAALKRAKVIIITGGLGPTADDLTRDVVSKVAKRPLIYDKSVEKKLQDRCKQAGIKFTKNMKIQCYFPKGSTAIPNPVGTADGFDLLYNGVHVITLSGVPAEMQVMFENYCIPLLRPFADKSEKIAYYKIFGIPEAHVDEKVQEIIKDSDAIYGITAKDSLVTVSLKGKKIWFDEQFRKVFGDCLFSTGAEGLEETTARMLMQKCVRLAVAESFTGGLITSKLTDISGISASLVEGRVTYSDKSKITMGVSERTIRRFGAVSEETSAQMAQAILKSSGADLSLSATGIAGPTGATGTKPVGLSYISLANKGNVVVSKFLFSGSRSEIKEKASLHAINILRLYLIKNYPSNNQ